MIPELGLGAAWSAVQAFFGKVPVWLRWTLLGLVIAAGGFFLHQHEVKKHDVAIIEAERNRVEAIARKIIGEQNAKNAALAGQLRKANDEKAAAIHSDARDVFMRGPGASRATCPGLAASPSRSQPASGNANAAGPQVPSDDRAAVPWGWLTDRAEQADLNRSEALAWRQWYATFSDQWAKWQAESAKARAKP